MSTLRSDLVTRARDYLNEATADYFSDAQLQRYAVEEILSLPNKDIYLEDIYQTTLSSSTDYSTGLSLPSGTIKVEELLQSTDSSNAYWDTLNGWDTYNNAIYFNFDPGDITIRAKIRKTFTAPSDDVTPLDVPDDKCEVVVWGMVVRAYKQLIGYLSKSKNWDAISKPDGISISSVQSWLRDAMDQYKELVKQYATVSRPREIDLVS